MGEAWEVETTEERQSSAEHQEFGPGKASMARNVIRVREYQPVTE
jgi:hypothetical protein